MIKEEKNWEGEIYGETSLLYETRLCVELSIQHDEIWQGFFVNPLSSLKEQSPLASAF